MLIDSLSTKRKTLFLALTHIILICSGSTLSAAHTAKCKRLEFKVTQINKNLPDPGLAEVTMGLTNVSNKTISFLRWSCSQPRLFFIDNPFLQRAGDIRCETNNPEIVTLQPKDSYYTTFVIVDAGFVIAAAGKDSSASFITLVFPTFEPFDLRENEFECKIHHGKIPPFRIRMNVVETNMPRREIFRKRYFVISKLISIRL